MGRFKTIFLRKWSHSHVWWWSLPNEDFYEAIEYKQVASGKEDKS
jgi:hypothetical protein